MGNKYKINTRIKELMLEKKFRQYLYSSLITMAAMSLSDFVDGMVVSYLLGPVALAVVNTSLPIVTASCAIYILFGTGGTILYSEFLGKRDAKRANSVLSTSLIAAVVSGVLLLVVGLFRIETTCRLLCPGLVLGDAFVGYVKAFLISIPFLITSNLLFMFLPAAGAPEFSMGVNIAANVLNLILDVVFIRGFGFGVEGAAYATLISFSSGGLLVLVFLGKIHLKFGVPDFSLMKSIMRKGLAASVSQLGHSIKFIFCTHMVSLLGGSNGLIAFSLCTQALQMISIAVWGVANTIKPLIAFLRAQEDFAGVRIVLHKAVRICVLVSAAFSFVLLVYPQVIALMFNVRSPEVLSIAKEALRFYSPSIAFRAPVFLYMIYTSILGMTVYSSFLSITDSLFGIVLFGMILSKFMGLAGIWLAFTLTEAVLLIAVFIINRYLKKRYPEKFADNYLIERENVDIHLLDISLETKNEEISRLSEDTSIFCIQNGVSEKMAYKIGLCAEEMAVYIRQHKNKNDWLNLILRIHDTVVTMDFRSIDSPYDLSRFSEKDLEENFKLLGALTSRYEYIYSMGMSNARFTFQTQEGSI